MANDYITAQPALVEGSLESATLRPAGVGTVSREAVRPQPAACHPHVLPRPVLWERSHGSTRAAHGLFQGPREEATSATEGT